MVFREEFTNAQSILPERGILLRTVEIESQWDQNEANSCTFARQILNNTICPEFFTMAFVNRRKRIAMAGMAVLTIIEHVEDKGER